MEEQKKVYVLKNFKITGNKYEDFDFIKIKQDEDVFFDLPVCLCEYGRIYKEPLVTRLNDSPHLYCVEKDELIEKLKGTKVFYLDVLDNGELVEVEKGQHKMSVRMLESDRVEDFTVNKNNLLIRKEGIKKNGE
jgi:hypothetical protein